MAPAGGSRRPALTVFERGGAADGTRPAPAARRGPIDWSILMAHAQAGDREAYRRLLGEIAPYVRSLAAKCHRNASDIEDCVQDVLLTVHAVRHTYDPLRPFAPWLVAIAHRRIADRLRRLHRVSLRELPLTDEQQERLAAASTHGDEAASDARRLREAIARLPPAQREAIHWLKLHELSLREAAAASGMTIGALKVATHRALKSLRRMLRAGDA
jgi:RNA polymerase sigma-70 factor (ECF subfamily)